MTIFLCGFMGCGKSTVGVKLAKSLNVPFTDMDAYIEEQAGKKITEIFAEDGEEHFRDLETQAVWELASRDGIIACGGGAMLRDINAQIAAEHGTVLFLDVPFRMCWLRIANTDGRSCTISTASAGASTDGTARTALKLCIPRHRRCRRSKNFWSYHNRRHV